MKKLLTIAVLLIWMMGTAQEHKENQFTEDDYEPFIPNFDFPGLEIDCITEVEIFQYVKECLSDTIIAEKYKGKHWKKTWYLIPYKYGFETTTEKQLERRGYIYSHVWVVGVDEEGLIEVRYYFVKEPTFKGFAKWLENR